MTLEKDVFLNPIRHHRRKIDTVSSFLVSIHPRNGPLGPTIISTVYKKKLKQKKASRFLLPNDISMSLISMCTATHFCLFVRADTPKTHEKY